MAATPEGLAKRLANLLPGGVVGHKGGSGMPPREYRDWCQQAVWSDKVRARIIHALETQDPFPESLWAKVADRGFGKPVESIDMTGKVEHTLVIVHRRGE